MFYLKSFMLCAAKEFSKTWERNTQSFVLIRLSGYFFTEIIFFLLFLKIDKGCHSVKWHTSFVGNSWAYESIYGCRRPIMGWGKNDNFYDIKNLWNITRSLLKIKTQISMSTRSDKNTRLEFIRIHVSSSASDHSWWRQTLD